MEATAPPTPAVAPDDQSEHPVSQGLRAIVNARTSRPGSPSLSCSVDGEHSLCLNVEVLSRTARPSNARRGRTSSGRRGELGIDLSAASPLRQEV